MTTGILHLLTNTTKQKLTTKFIYRGTTLTDLSPLTDLLVMLKKTAGRKKII
jgi:hypothetical protein